MAIRELELTSLHLDIRRNGKSAQFPVLRADLRYKVGAFPAVQVTISSAAVFGAAKKGADIKELFEDSPEGSEATLWLFMYKEGNDDEDGEGGGDEGDREGYTPNNGNSLVKIPLFSGYVSGTGSLLLTSIYTVQSSITFQLVCRAAAVNANPGGAFNYFRVAGGNNKYSPKPYLLQLQANANRSRTKSGASGKTVLTELAETFITNPAKSIIGLIDELRNIDREGFKMAKVGDGFYTDDIALALKIKAPPIKIIQRFSTSLVNALMGTPATGVALSVLQSLFLSVIPQTIGSPDGSPCLLIVRPGVSGWHVKPSVELATGDILGISDSVSYRLDQRVDFWYVQASQDEVGKSMNLAAVYAPGFGENGEAKFLDLNEFTKEVDKTSKNESSLIGRATILPWWLFLAVEVTKPVPPKPPADPKANTPVDNGGTSVGETRDHEASQTAWEAACKQLAVNSFLENGCAVNAVTLKVPFYTMLRLLPWLGDTISFEVPSPQQTTRNNELYKITAATRYGLLDGLSITLECSYKGIQVNCSATLSQVHDKELHERMSAENKIYTEASDKCYNPAALGIGNEVLNGDW